MFTLANPGRNRSSAEGIPLGYDKERRSVVVSRQEAVEFVRDLLLAAPEIAQVDSEVVHRLLQRISIPLGIDRIKCHVDCCGFPVCGQSGIEATQPGQVSPAMSATWRGSGRNASGRAAASSR